MRKQVLQMIVLFLVMIVTATHTRAFDIEEYGLEGGPVLIFIPGLASHGELWKPWVSQYQKTHRVFVMTAPGFAASKPKETASGFLQARIDEVSVFLKNKNVKEVSVVRHSIGGLMSLMLAGQHPDLVKRVLVVDSLPYMAGLFAPGLTPEQAEVQAKFVKDQMKAMPHDAFVAQQKQGAYILSKTPEFIPTLNRWAETSDQETIANAFGDAFAMDYRRNLKGIKAQVTVMAAHDPQMPITRSAMEALYKEQYADLDNKQLMIVDDSFHFIMIDQPRVFAQALGNFIK